MGPRARSSAPRRRPPGPHDAGSEFPWSHRAARDRATRTLGVSLLAVVLAGLLAWCAARGPPGRRRDRRPEPPERRRRGSREARGRRAGAHRRGRAHRPRPRRPAAAHVLDRRRPGRRGVQHRALAVLPGRPRRPLGRRRPAGGARGGRPAARGVRVRARLGVPDVAGAHRALRDRPLRRHRHRRGPGHHADQRRAGDGRAVRRLPSRGDRRRRGRGPGRRGASDGRRPARAGPQSAGTPPGRPRPPPPTRPPPSRPSAMPCWASWPTSRASRSSSRPSARPRWSVGPRSAGSAPRSASASASTRTTRPRPHRPRRPRRPRRRPRSPTPTPAAAEAARSRPRRPRPTRDPDAHPRPDAGPGTEPHPCLPRRPRRRPPPSPPRPPAPSGDAAAAVAFAAAQLGDAYRWGAAGPDAWDCSGLMMMAWRAGGIALPHSSGGSVRRRDADRCRRPPARGPGLLGREPPGIYHVAMYVGGGEIIHAPRTGRPVSRESMYYWTAPDYFARP